MASEFGKAKQGHKRIETQTEGYPINDPMMADLMRLNAQCVLAVAEACVKIAEEQAALVDAITTLNKCIMTASNHVTEQMIEDSRAQADRTETMRNAIERASAYIANTRFSGG